MARQSRGPLIGLKAGAYEMTLAHKRRFFFESAPRALLSDMAILTNDLQLMISGP